ncbi:MAG: hypothetical protein ACLRTD_26070 [Bacteroides sp.]
MATPQLSAPTVTTKQSVPNTYKTCMIQRMGGYHPLKTRGSYGSRDKSAIGPFPGDRLPRQCG